PHTLAPLPLPRCTTPLYYSPAATAPLPPVHTTVCSVSAARSARLLSPPTPLFLSPCSPLLPAPTRCIPLPSPSARTRSQTSLPAATPVSTSSAVPLPTALLQSPHNASLAFLF